MNDNVAAYRKTGTLGNSQLDLIIQVYDGAISNMNAAAQAYRNEDDSAGRESLEKAKKFVTHLYTTLDSEKGGDIAEQLGKMYAFVINEINVIEGTKDLQKIDDNMTVLKNLRLGWVGLKEQELEQVSPVEPSLNIENGSFVTSA